MHRVLMNCWFSAAVLASLLATSSAVAAIPAAQRRQIEALEPLVVKAGRLFLDKKYKESGNVVREIQTKLDDLATSGDKEVLAELTKIHRRLEKAHTLLELEGISLPPLKKLPADAAERVEVKPLTGKETVSFTNEIAPVLDEQCAKCHGRERRAGAHLNLATFSGLWKGGDNGPPIPPGKPADSLLFQKLTGKADGEAMPLQGPALADAVLKKIEKWIAEGALFDGTDPDQDLGHLADVRKAQKTTHNELSNNRLQLATRNWTAYTAGAKNDRAETSNFLLLGDVGLDNLQKYGKLADWLVAKVGDVFGATSTQTFVKGRITLYVFQQRADCAAFAKKLDNRDLPEQSPGYWRYTVLEAYAAIVAPQNTEYTMEALLVQEAAAVYLTSLGKMPPWFAEGSARAAAAKLKADDARVADWDQQLPKIVASLNRPDDFATGKLSEETAAIASYGFAKHLMKDTKRYLDLLEAVRQGKDFQPAFSATYGGSLLQIAKDWVNETGK